MEKVLVTGGCGFIGSNFVRMLVEKPGVKVVNLDLLTYAGNLDNLRGLEKKKNYEFVKGDIADKKIVEKAMDGCDVVFNFAAESHVDNSIIDSDPFVRTNVSGTKTMLDVARKNKVERFVQISTDEVYGSVEKGSSSEDDKLDPRNPYSACKAAGDLLALSYANTYDLNVVVTRSSNNYGPYQYPEKFMPLAITNLIEGKKIPVYGDGTNVRDWLWVKDNCSGIMMVAERGKAGNIYNIGGGNEMRNIDVAKKIIYYMGKSDSEIQFVKDRAGHDKRYSLDSSKAMALGWKPEKKFEDGLVETIEWYKSNEWWWKPLKAKK